MTSLPTLMRRHPLVGFFLIAYAVSWAVWVPMAVAGARVRQGSAWPNHIPGLFGPVVAAFAMSAAVGGRASVRDLLRRMFRWRVAVRWYLVALSPLALFAIAAVASAATGRGWPDPAELGRFSSLPVVSAPLMWLLLVITAYAEETGWRGFAVPQLMKTRGLLPTALVVGALWALWHVPSMFVIENYRQLGPRFLPGFFLGIVAGSVFLAWLYDASGGSVLVVAVWHATYNLFSGTAAAHGLVAAIVSTAVVAWAVWIVVLELRHGLDDRTTGAPLMRAG